MADRYWRGGSGSWNTTTNWSATSGGAGGASVPTAADNVIFDTNSGSGTAHYTVTVTDNSTCANLTFTPETAIGVTEFVVSNGFVIAGTFSTSSTAGNRRLWIRSSTYGLMRDMRIAAIGSVSDVDFRDIRVTGAGGTLSGTRIGDLRGNSGITFSTPKTVYWNLAAGGNWSANAWAATSGGAVSTDNFPLAQDTAVIGNTGLNTSATVTVDVAIPYIGTVNMSTRTNAMTFANGTDYLIYGNWINGSGVTLGTSNTLRFSGRNTQTITSAGKIFAAINIESYGGTIELADALNIGAQTLTVTNGTLDTKGYAVTAGELSSSNSNVRAINLGASTLTLSGGSAINFSDSTNLTFNAGTSNISVVSGNVTGGSQTFYNITWTAAVGTNIAGNNTFNNVTVNAPAATGRIIFTFSANQIISGTLTVAGASPVRRIFVQSTVLGTQRDLTVGTLAATDCDFRDIDILGAAAGSTPTRAGDCGGNAGITFPAPKSVYWNLAGAQNWSATGWAASSGGTPDINNFPLAQDTAVFDNTGSVTGTITINAAWNIGTFDASARTSAMTLTTGSIAPFVYGDWLFGTGVTSSSTTGTITFASRGTNTITSNGVSFGCPITVNGVTGTIQLADALTLGSTRVLTLTSGTFDAVSYNVTVGQFANGSSSATLKMGSGTWTLSGTSTVWGLTTFPIFYKGTANIVLSDTSASERTFDGGSRSYNKLTIGGATGTSTLTITGDNTFTELASTKTVAHTVSMNTGSQNIGKWSITGTAGNVVTFTGSGGGHNIVGARVSGVDYLVMGTTSFNATSPGEFYAGANSTGVGAGVILTAAPAAVTRYWVGGTATWTATNTTNWSASSGGAGGASVPTSADAVVFDSLSNATAYTVTCTATQLRCGSLTMAKPLTGNVTWAGTAPLAIHDNVSLAATGITRTYTGAITLSGSATGKTFTTNGVTLASTTTVNGVGCGWSLGSILSIGTSNFTNTNGDFNFAGFSFTGSSVISTNNNKRTINFANSTLTLSSSSVPLNFGTTESERADLTITSGTSQVNLSAGVPSINGNNKTFYNVSLTSGAASGLVTINGINTFNNLSMSGTTSAGLNILSLSANQTINGTLTLSAGADATRRTLVRSDTIGTTRTLTCAAVSATDADFRDIAIAGAAAPVSGTRLGDCKGNSGITFDAAKTVYWNLAGNNNWSATAWATSAGGTPAANNFPLAQDSAVFTSTSPATGATTTINAAYNIGTIDMSARTSNTMTLATGTTQPQIYGNWINGTGTTLAGNGLITFSGRGSQTITSSGKTFTQRFNIDTPVGSVVLQDAFICSGTSTFTLTQGTLDANGYNFTLSDGASQFAGGGSSVRTVAIGSGVWTIAGSVWSTNPSTNLTVTGTGTISLTSASAKTFAGGGISYSGITLNQGGAGALTITGNNTFGNITNTYKATGATSIALGTTTQRVGAFGASGEAGRVLTVTGTSATSPATLVFTGSGQATTPTTDYLTITGVRAYSLDTTWYAGNNSTNNGSLGWYFVAGVVVAGYLGNFFAFF